VKLDKKLLSDYHEEYHGYHNALGLYDTMQFVLRLRPDVHKIIEKLPNRLVKSNELDFESFQAFSTYLHETVHWWQHIGSTSGLLLSLSYPSQMHINDSLLEDFIKETGKIKSIEKYNRLYAKHYEPEKQTNEFHIINQILNNYHDIEFFKHITINPKHVKTIIENGYFVSIGHSFHITYSTFISVLAASFDRDFSFLPNLDTWVDEFSKLNTNKINGYHPNSDIYLSPIGLKEIYEGQARFIQMQYLYAASGKKLTWDSFDELGMLSGVYIEAFNFFIKTLDEQKPESIKSPLVALFLLVCDISINPGDGFPFEIKDYEQFINNTDPGIRFIRLCTIIKDKAPEVKYQIVDYSTSEYYNICIKICTLMGIPTPMDISNEIVKWSKSFESLILLMEEEKIFDFKNENFPIRLIFSRFIRFQEDKLKNPAFFCWAGMHMTEKQYIVDANELFDEHQALYRDGIDADIYPSIIPNKDEKLITKTMNEFYTWVTLYGLVKQWIMEDGDFKYDYLWLTSKFTQSETREWAKSIFKQKYNCSPDEFESI